MTVQQSAKPIRAMWNLVEYGLNAAGNGTGIFLNLLSQILFARLLGKAGLGVVTLTLSLVFVLSSFLDLGLRASVPRFIAFALGKERPDWIHSIVIRCGSILCASCLVLVLTVHYGAQQFSQWFHSPDLESALRWFVYFVPALYVQQFTASILRGMGSVSLQIALRSYVLESLVLLCGVGFWLYHPSFLSVVLGYGIAYTVVALAGVYGSVQVLRPIWISQPGEAFPLRKILHQSLPLSLSSIEARLSRRGDILVVGALLGESMVGLYRVAYSLASGIACLTAPINEFVLYRMSRSAGRNDIQEVLKHFRSAVLFNLAMTLPVYILVYSWTGWLLPLIFGNDFREGEPVVQVLCMGFAVFTTIGPMGQLFNALAKNWVRAWLVAISTVITIGLHILLILHLGVIGAALGTSGGFVILLGLYSVYLYHLGLKTGVRKESIRLLGLALMFMLLNGSCMAYPIGWRLGVSFMSAGLVGVLGFVLSYRSFQTLHKTA